jgi:hypothetical protein
MNKKGLKLALTALLAVSQAFALSEVRTPWISGSGPLRYVFENDAKDGKYAMNLWSVGHSKYANKAFLKHGTKTQDLTALIFNKSNFALSEAFYNQNSDPSNPLASFKQVSPRVEYNEMGMTVGGEISMPVWKNKGRLGLRGSVPFRSIELERLDSGLDKAEDPTADYVSGKVVKVTRRSDGAAAGAGAAGTLAAFNLGSESSVLAKAYRLDLLRALVDADGNKILTSGAAAAAGLKVFGTQIGTGGGNELNGNFAGIVPGAVANGRQTGKPVNHGYMLYDGGGFGLGAGRDGLYGNGIAGPINNIVPLRGDLANISGESARLNTFISANDYNAALSNFSADEAKKYWLIFRRTHNSVDASKFGNGDGNNVGGGRGITDNLDNYIAQFNENAFVYLAKQGISLDGQVRTGLGDIDVETFYRHTLNENWDAELQLGVRLPTGGDKDKYGSPYKSMLGNGEHWEIKIGGLLAWEAMSWMNLKADASYHFVLESTENRMAVFAGSTVKNLGPKAAADVDWGYFVGHVDATFFHPKNRDIRSVLGYELYYKLEDRLTYKNATAVAFDGGAKALSSKLAVKNTESIGHKVRFETSYQVSKYFEFFAGGSFTFAGQNVARDRDTHGGFNIRF